MYTPESHSLTWRTSSYSTNGGNCVEVGRERSAVLVRDTKDRAGGALSLNDSAWSALLRTQHAA